MSEAQVEKAVRDLERHTLGGMPGTLAKLVYLSSVAARYARISSTNASRPSPAIQRKTEP